MYELLVNSTFWPPSHACTTDMRFSVSVPVLSLQMSVALPIVSHAASTRIKFWSASIFRVEYANEIVTASGSPSGIATTMIVTAVMKAWMSQSLNSGYSSSSASLFANHEMIIAANVRMAAAVPT